jgi:homoserine kinase type II
LRLCLPGGPRHRRKEEILAEIELLEYLDFSKFPVILPLADKVCQRLIAIDGYNGYLREMMAAREIEKPSLVQINKFGQLLGRLHNLTENYQGEFRRDHEFNPEHTRLIFKERKEIILAGDLVKKEKFVDDFEQVINGLSFPDELPSGMLHEDLGKRHVLWAGDEIVALIDFDRAYIGKLIWDVGQALRGWAWLEAKSDNLDEALAKSTSLLKGYQVERKLTDLEKNNLADAVKFAFLERAQAFAFRYTEVTQDKIDADFAWENLEEIGLIEQEKNRLNNIF